MALEKQDTPIIASLDVEARTKDGATIPVTVEIGTPYHRETGEWACPVRLKGLHDNLADASGEGSLQALCMALSLALDLLQDVRDKGGAVTSQGSDLPIDAYAFGPAQR